MRLTAIAATTAALIFTACQPSGGDNAKLDEVLSRIEKIEKQVQQVAARPGAQRQQPRRPDPKQVYYVPVDNANDPFIGAEHAKVTIVEASEFACPYCAMVSPTMQKLVENHGDDVKVVTKTLLIHPQIATEPALAACAAHKQGKFPEFEHKLWASAWNMDSGRPQLDRDKLGKEALTGLASEIGLDMTRFDSDMQGKSCKDMLRTHRQQMQAIGVRGTPSIFINGRPYAGQRSYEAIEAAVLAEKKKAEAALAQGKQIAQYYDSIIAKGKKTL